jgi:hypothetical protein
MPLPDLAITLCLTKQEANCLQDILDNESWRFQQKRKPGAGPGPKERLLNELAEEVVYGISVARSIVPPRNKKPRR